MPTTIDLGINNLEFSSHIPPLPTHLPLQESRGLSCLSLHLKVWFMQVDKTLKSPMPPGVKESRDKMVKLIVPSTS